MLGRTKENFPPKDKAEELVEDFSKLNHKMFPDKGLGFHYHVECALKVARNVMETQMEADNMDGATLMYWSHVIEELEKL